MSKEKRNINNHGEEGKLEKKETTKYSECDEVGENLNQETKEK